MNRDVHKYRWIRRVGWLLLRSAMGWGLFHWQNLSVLMDRTPTIRSALCEVERSLRKQLAQTAGANLILQPAQEIRVGGRSVMGQSCAIHWVFPSSAGFF